MGKLLTVKTRWNQNLCFSHCSAETCFRLLSSPKLRQNSSQSQSLGARKWKWPNANNRTNKPAITGPLSVSLHSETKSKATPRGLSRCEHGFAIINYPKIISVPSAAVFTSSVFARGLIAAALAALQNESWGCSKLLITTIIQWQQGVINLKPNTLGNTFFLKKQSLQLTNTDCCWEGNQDKRDQASRRPKEEQKLVLHCVR